MAPRLEDPWGPPDFDPSRPPVSGPPPPPPPPMGPPPPPLPPLHPDAQAAPIPWIPGGQAPRLRAMRVGELLDTSIKLYRENWKLFMGIVAFVFVPIQFVESFLTREVAVSPFSSSDRLPTDSQLNSGLLITAIFGLVIFLFVLPFLTAAIARATSEVYLGSSPTVGDIYRFALSMTPAVLWATFLVFMTTVLGLVAFLIPGFIFFVRFSFTPSIVAIEGRRGTRAMRRSWELSKGFFWKIFGTVFLAGIMTGLVGGILQIPLSVAGAAIGPSGWILNAIGGSAASIVTRPFAGIVIVLVYFDMRIRKEGFDLALMAQEIAGPPQP
jgi:hypothetical protein